jgi:Holliday junction resolvase RusA-like endonuclease
MTSPDPAIICRFALTGYRPIPWKATVVGTQHTRTGKRYRFVTKDPTLVAWQEVVALHARLAMAGRRPYEGAVELRMDFTLRPIKGRMTPDTCNLTKSTEDALQGIVIADDRQVVSLVAARWEGREEGAVIEVRAL